MTCNPNDYGCGKYPELEPVLDKYADVRGSLITVLQKTQDIYGYIPVDAINHIGDRIHVKPSKIYSVATFYAQFRLEPVGKYLIMLCKGTACHVNGTDSIEEAITEFRSASLSIVIAKYTFTASAYARAPEPPSRSGTSSSGSPAASASA